MSNDFVSFPFYGPWGSWYPWYSGFGGFGFLSYSPWRYGATRWYWSPYGLWYDPYTYDWDPYYGGGSYSSSYRDREPKEVKTTGTLRIKANLDAAKIYIDNALVGTVAEFDGLKGQLEVDGGRHTFELRADGYTTFKQEIDVKVGKTQTIRASLKEKK